MLRLALVLPVLAALAPTALAQSPPRPLRLAVAGLTHTHVHGLLGRADRGDVEIVGIYEPDTALAGRYARQHGLDARLLHTDFEAMLDAVRPEAVAAFGSTRAHRAVVEAAAPRGLHVMVEKPLAVSVEDALAMRALAEWHGVHLLTNYETTWYPSTHAAYDVLVGERALGPLRKLVVHDGHAGPRAIGVNEEFLAWLTDPVENGGGALMDFGCYGANLATWLRGGAAPLTVTAVTQHLQPKVYPRVDDEATIILTYPDAQAIIQASWNWPISRKSMEVYGRTGQALAPDGRTLRVRTSEADPETARALAPRPAPYDDPFAYFAAVVRGTVEVAPADLSALANNVTVVRILDAARRSAATGQTVRLDDP